MRVLETRRRGVRPATEAPHTSPEIVALPRIPSIGGEPSVRGRPALFGMRRWLQQLGHTVPMYTHLHYSDVANSKQTADINRLKIIHVAGTKGKGGTCAYIECLLRNHGQRTGFPKKTGLYTSPHLIDTEERIRINFGPLNKDVFAKYVSEVHGALQSSTGDPQDGPRYLQFLALVSFHTFIKEGVDVAIYETHQGGEYDATNVIPKPVVTAITLIDEDHMHQLGPSLENVAWHKAGIFKPGAPAFSAPQQTAVATILQKRAVEKGVTLKFIEVCVDLPSDVPQPKPEVQLQNFSLARAVSNSFLQQTATQNNAMLSSHDIVQGIRAFSWPGRFQSILDGNLVWFLDGAHNTISLEICAQWFAQTSSETGYLTDSLIYYNMLIPSSSVCRVLIFGHCSSHRDHVALLKTLACSLLQHNISIQHVVFTTCQYTRSASNSP